MSKTAAEELKAEDAQIKAYQECARQYVNERHAKALMYVSAKSRGRRRQRGHQERQCILRQSSGDYPVASSMPSSSPI